MEFDFYKTRKNKTVDKLKSILFDKIQDAFFVLTISAKNDYDMPFISDSAYEMFEIQQDAIFTNTILSAYNQIYKEDKKLVKQSLIDSLRRQKNWNVVFSVLLPIKGFCWFKITSKREVNTDGSVEL